MILCLPSPSAFLSPNTYQYILPPAAEEFANIRTAESADSCEIKSSRVRTVGVDTAIMSRAVFSLLLQFLVLCFANQVVSAVAPEDCVDFDILELESYLSRLNLHDVPSSRSMTGGFKCPVNALPYGALKSDWARLLLLQEAQPKGSNLRPKLDRLFRILAVAYFQMEENFHITFDRLDVPTNSTNAISKVSTENSYTSNEEDGENRLISSAESIGLAKKENPLSRLAQIARSNSTATVEGNQETSEPLMYPGETSVIATSYHDPMERMLRPQISRKPPSGMNEFWNYVVIPKRVPPSTLASIGPLSARGDEVKVARGDETTSALHASLNSNAQKIFRWFYSPDRGPAFDSAAVSKTGAKVGCQARGKDKSCCS